MELHNLTPRPGSTKDRKRVGRGPGSGHGKTAGRGHKGAQSRSGYKRRRNFEGGQMPYVRRLPKRGFTNIFRTELTIVNVGQLDRFPTGSEITPELLLAEGVISSLGDGLKVLGHGRLEKMLVVKAHKFSRKALEVIQSVGGRCEVIAK
ncbi:MAG: 50S ribosomal protein L15 [Thermoanaerobaculaceae bacterium]|nr:50S ribosomal protein L15 [Thermoanaerobaculaceae bacterium]MDI9622313.1 50S ribosomal protein L15 [Acidobacteriota bacterium]NLH10611.1 50S ribosomal protein L15 [Holophagae bacterium]HPW55067.1 50S ribosomal protein L15 [Thermoanaerobaculaceae bacterium]